MADRKGGNFVFDNNWSNEETFRLATALNADGYENTVGAFINEHRNDGWTPDIWRTQISKLIFDHLWDTYDRLDANTNRVEDLLITQPGLFGFRICEISEAYMRKFGLDGSDTKGSSKKSRKSKTNASKPTKSSNIKSRTGHRVRKSKESNGKTLRRNQWLPRRRPRRTRGSRRARMGSFPSKPFRPGIIPVPWRPSWSMRRRTPRRSTPRR